MNQKLWQASSKQKKNSILFSFENYISKKFGINKPIVINNYVPIYKIPQEKTHELKTTLKINNNYPILFYSGGVYDDRFIAFEKILETLANIKRINEYHKTLK